MIRPDDTRPPHGADRLLAWFCAPALLEEVQGDLYELYHRRVACEGVGHARRRYWLDVLRFFRPFALRRKPDYEQARGPIMLKNYLWVALRTLRRHPGYTFLNVAGLAVGLACCLLMLLFVQDELAYDRFHANADRVVRVAFDEDKEGGLHVRTASTPIVLATLLKDEFPEIEATTRLMRYGVFNTPVVSRNASVRFQEPGFFFVDSTFFDVFSYPFRRGDPATALDAPMTVVLTAAMAAKYFGDEDPLGKTLTFENRAALTVTGVLAEGPAPSHLDFDFAASFSSLRTIEGTWLEQSWHWPPVCTYVLLPPGMEAAALEAALPGMLQARLRPELAARVALSLQPLTRIHLHSHRENELSANGDIAYVYLFSAAAFFILLLACINFVNLVTARATQRAREVGMRKVLGAQRGQLVRQFLGESLLLTGVSLLVALALAGLVLPAFNAVAGKALRPADFFDGVLPLALVGLALGVGLLAGSYPAFYLSAFRPVRVLKGGGGRGGTAAARFRQGLVVFQFTVTCVLLVGTAVVFQQLDFLQTTKLGFDKEHVVVVDLGGDAGDANFDVLKQRWQQHPGVLAASATSDVPPSTENLYDFPLVLRGERADSLEMLSLTIDEDFAETFGLEVLAGRDLSEDFPTDATEGFLLNEAAVQRLGLDEPVGTLMTLYHFAGEPRYKTGQVVGVVRDFHYESLRRAIDPIVFFVLPVTGEVSYYNNLSVRIRPDDVPGTLAFLEREWQAFQPDRPFNYTFLDAQFDALYRAERRLGRLFGYCAGLAIFIACLGLFGLASFTAAQRTKEIGVRKVMGASVPGLVTLLSKDFVKLVALAFLVAAPLSFFAMRAWLDGFAYRVAISWWIFLGVGAAALAIALLTVSYQAVKAALADPVEALRYE